MDIHGHLEKARKNWTLLEKLSYEVDYADWSVVVLYYTALHIADAVLQSKGVARHRSHGERNQAIRDLVAQNLLNEEPFSAYLQLFSRSRALLYENLAITSEEFKRLLGVFRSLESQLLKFLPDVEKMPALTIEAQ